MIIPAVFTTHKFIIPLDMSSQEADQKAPQMTSDAGSRTSQLAADLPTYSAVDLTDSSKSEPVMFEVSEHGSPSSVSSKSSDGSDESIEFDSETSDSSQTSTSSIKPTGDWDSHCLPADFDDPPIRLPTLSFCDPLSDENVNIKFYGNVAVDAERHPFLCSFLQRTRYTDIPFGTAHRLLDAIMHLLQWGAYCFLRSRGSDYLHIRGAYRECADEIELEHLVKKIIEHKMVDVSWHYDLYDRRLAATHSWVYGTDEILMAVIFLGLLKDEGRLTNLGQLLRTIYYTHKQSNEEVSITDDDIEQANLALHYTPAEPKTQHLLLHRVQELLEKACFNYWTKHNPQRLTELEWHKSDKGCHGRMPRGTVPFGWDCPERVELQMWCETPGLKWDFTPWPKKPDIYNPDFFYEDDFTRLLKSAVALRNLTAHRIYREDGYQPETLFEMLRDAEDLARVLGDQAASEEISGFQDHSSCQDLYAMQSKLTEERRLEDKERYDEAKIKWQAWLAADDTAKLGN